MHGNIMHLAMADQRLEIMRFLLSDHRVERNLQNEYGWTAKDIFKEGIKNGKVKITQMSITLSQAKPKLLSSKKIKKKAEKLKLTSWFNDQRSALMVVASVVATMAFQASLTPPFKKPGEGVATNLPYLAFVIANTVGSVSSMGSLIFLISMLPGRRFFVVLAMLMMWLAVSCVAFISAISLTLNVVEMQEYIYPPNNSTSTSTSESESEVKASNLLLDWSVGLGIKVWACVMVLIFVWHVAAWMRKLFVRCFHWLGKKIKRVGSKNKF